MIYKNTGNYLISKKTIKGWLENYHAIMLGGQRHDILHDAVPYNSGPKSIDGVTNRQINKIMLTAAIKDMPTSLKKCLYHRWVKPEPLGETLRKLKLTSPSSYYRRCDWAIDYIYCHINNLDLEKAQLLRILQNRL